MPAQKHFWDTCFGKRPADELYDLHKDPDCVTNLAGQPEHAARQAALQQQLFAELKQQEDPRLLGKGAEFDAYPYANERERGFYDRYLKGEKPRAGWVNESDFEQAPME